MTAQELWSLLNFYKSVFSGEQIDTAIGVILNGGINAAVEEAEASAAAAAQSAKDAAGSAAGLGDAATNAKNSATQAAESAEQARLYAEQAHAIAGEGLVFSVNNVQADETGNVPLGADTVGAIPVGEKGTAGGVAALDDTGKVPAAQLPPVTPEAIGAGRVNPNLLHNWYFGNPVNQRGQAEYSGEACTIDRWKLNGSNGVLYVRDKYIETTGVTQTIEHGEEYFGMPLTLSILYEDSNGGLALLAETHTITAGQIFTGSQSGTDRSMPTYALGSTAQGGITVSILKTTAGAYPKVYAVKLELGTHQTLAHQDTDGSWVLNEIPDYYQQLALCQHFAVPVGGTFRYRACFIATSFFDFAIPLPQSLRVSPSFDVSAFSVYSIDGGKMTVQTGFTFAATLYKTGVLIRATKTGHGLTDAILDIAANTILSADL